MTINKSDLEDILYGACFLASGGGGPLSLGQSLIDAGFETSDSVEVVDISSLEDTDWLIPSSGMGEPSASFNASSLNQSIVNVIEVMNHWCQNNINEFEKFKYIFPMEVGTVNSVLPIIAAKNSGYDLKVINGDPSGRATPTLPLNLLAGNKCDFYPNFIANGDKDKTLFASFNLGSLDEVQTGFSNTFTSSSFKNSGGFSLYPMSKKDFSSNYIVEYTMEDALNIGKIIEDASLTTAYERACAIKEYMNEISKEKRQTDIMFYGTLSNINSVVVNGVDVGNLIINGINEFKNKELKIATANENIFANIIENNEESTFITGPDSICFLLEVLDSKDELVENIKILDASALENLFNCPVVKTINLYVLRVTAAQKVRECKQLIETWNQFSQALGGEGNYPLPS